MSLFTIVLEHRGTSAVQQVTAATAKAALAKWAKAFDYEGVLGISKKVAGQLARDLAHATPIPVRRTKNVWGLTALAHGQMALVRLIHTQDAKK